MRRKWIFLLIAFLAIGSLAFAELRSADISRKTGVRGFGYHYYILTTLVRELYTDHGTNVTAIDEFTETINELITTTDRDGVAHMSTTSRTGFALIESVENGENLATLSDGTIRHKGGIYPVAADTEIDISALTCGGDIITQNKSGVIWVFVNTAGTFDCETPITAGTQAYSSAIKSLETYSTATNTLPPGTDDVCVGCCQITEGNSGDFTIGTDDISTETETFYSFITHPGVETAGTIEVDTDATTISYAASVVRLGTGTRVAATGKANVALPTDTVANGYTGAYLIYVLADDTESIVQLGSYASSALAAAAVRDHTPNPLLALIGVMYVANASGSTFTGATTKLDATGITTTITALGTGSAHLEVGRAALNQPHQVLQNAGPSSLTASQPNAVVAGDYGQ